MDCTCWVLVGNVLMRWFSMKSRADGVFPRAYEKKKVSEVYSGRATHKTQHNNHSVFMCFVCCVCCVLCVPRCV